MYKGNNNMISVRVCQTQDNMDIIGCYCCC